LLISFQNCNLDLQATLTLYYCSALLRISNAMYNNMQCAIINVHNIYTQYHE